MDLADLRGFFNWLISRKGLAKMKARVIKIAIIFLRSLILTMPVFSDECMFIGNGHQITPEKGISNCASIKYFPVNDIIRMKNTEQSKEIAKFSSPSINSRSNSKYLSPNAIIGKNIEKPNDIAKSWAINPIPTVFTSKIIPIPTVFTSNVKLIAEGK